MVNSMRTTYVKIAAIFTLILVMVSCDRKNEAPVKSNEKTVRINVVSSDTWIKSQAAFEGENDINDVTLIINSIDKSSGTKTTYDKYYSETGSIDVTLSFSENVEYEFLAYANFGEMTEIPEVVNFIDEFKHGVRMHGEQTFNPGDAETTALTIPLKRYINKLIVNSVKLDWSKDYTEALSLKSIYVANAGKDNTTSSSYYNQDGIYQTTDVDTYLYDSLENIMLKNGETYYQRHTFYAMMGMTTEKPTSFVFETEYAGQKMYYTVPLELSENLCYILDFVIKDAGNVIPFGEKSEIPSSSIEVMVRTFAVEDWETTSETVYSESDSDSDIDFDTGWEEGEDIEL